MPTGKITVTGFYDNTCFIANRKDNGLWEIGRCELPSIADMDEVRFVSQSIQFAFQQIEKDNKETLQTAEEELFSLIYNTDDAMDIYAIVRTLVNSENIKQVAPNVLNVTYDKANGCHLARIKSGTVQYLKKLIDKKGECPVKLVKTVNYIMDNTESIIKVLDIKSNIKTI